MPDAPRIRRLAVIGAGISGLAAAWFAHSRAGAEVTVFEAGPRTGGVLQTIRRDGFVLEEGPDCFISTKPEALALCHELGLEGELIGTRPEFRRSYILDHGRLKPIPQGFFLLAPTSLRALAETPLLTWPGKLRAALDLVMPGMAEGDDESLASFVRRRFGEEVLDRIAAPMVGGIYTADPERLSLAATFPQFLAMERRRGSVIRGLMAGGATGSAAHRTEGATAAAGPRYGMFVSLKGGMATLPETLIARLPSGALRTSCGVRSVRRVAGGWAVESARGGTEQFDGVLIALPAHAAARLVSTEAPALASALGAVEYASCAIVNLAWPREAVAHPREGMGFVVPHIEGRRVLACSFSDRKWPGRAPDGMALFRVFIGGAMQAAELDRDDDGLVYLAVDELRRIVDAQGKPALASVTRWPRAMAQYHVGHIARVARLRELERGQQGLALAGNAFDGVGIPDCIRHAGAAVDRLFPARGPRA